MLNAQKNKTAHSFLFLFSKLPLTHSRFFPSSSSSSLRLGSKRRRREFVAKMWRRNKCLVYTRISYFAFPCCLQLCWRKKNKVGVILQLLRYDHYLVKTLCYNFLFFLPSTSENLEKTAPPLAPVFVGDATSLKRSFGKLGKKKFISVRRSVKNTHVHNCKCIHKE